ncbi:ABC transporter ATP-binding protein [Stygiolobus azoricus]|uniref:ATP-binding cassette domain-containing protein n=1 Tax=Stygiolobus azoricus TaxID=41675 RepID=A0A650CRE4_9CREN|nr:ABC transporter ATP-binding protein [Stygiolobus azoricus]QGR20414.1 ATP-binding cassette domain-containing protein [Stygiolobus azoricus]
MSETVVRAENVQVKYLIGRAGLFKRIYVNAVNGVSLDVKKGEIVSLIGESGSGKTTLGKAMLRLVDIYSGKIYWDSTDVTKDSKKDVTKLRDVTKLSEGILRRLRKNFQLIQQDPYGALDPRLTIYEILAEGLRLHKLVKSQEEEREKIYEILKIVKLTPPENFIKKRPYELSGGQRQRVVVARALLLQPKFIVADEPISMLDASTRGQILEFILKDRETRQTAYLFITHDISIASYISDRIAVMYLGKIVEMGKPEEVISEPLHPYTKALIDAVPVPDPDYGIKEPNIKGELPSPIELPSGCVFNPRCPLAKPICKEKEPELKKVKGDHYVACHLY